MSPHEPVCVVVLTKDEAANVAECLERLLSQLREGDDVVIVDAASGKETLDVCERFAHMNASRVRVHAFPVPVGPAEATGVALEMARQDLLVFLGANAIPEPGWLDALRGKAAHADIVYGRQRHVPKARNAPTVSRGLRYHHFDRTEDALPETFASSANSALRRYALATLRPDDAIPGAEDRAFAKKARLAGLRIAYADDAVVHHRDVASWRSEWARHRHLGAAQAQLRALLGVPKLHLLWAATVAMLAIAAVALASPWLLALCFVAFFAPTLRRLASPAARAYKPIDLARGAAVSPIFDLAFVGSYLARRVRSRG